MPNQEKAAEAAVVTEQSEPEATFTLSALRGDAPIVEAWANHRASNMLLGVLPDTPAEREAIEQARAIAQRMREQFGIERERLERVAAASTASSSTDDATKAAPSAA